MAYAVTTREFKHQVTPAGVDMMILRRKTLGNGTGIGLIMEANKHDASVCVARYDLVKINPETQYVVRWGCTAQIPEGPKVINKSAAISVVGNKLEFRRTLSKFTPDIVPKTWFNKDVANITYPCIVRPDKHAQGRKLHVCNNYAELSAACARYPKYYISEVITKAKEYRVYVVSGRVACVAEKIPADPKAIAWNSALGSTFVNVRWDDWPIAACRAAVKAWEQSGLDFGGVDVMICAKTDTPYVIEINSAPSLPLREKGEKAGGPTYRHECMFKALNHIIKNGQDQIPLGKTKGWRSVVHPAVYPKAK